MATGQIEQVQVVPYQQVEQTVNIVVSQARGMTVVTADDYEMCCSFLQVIAKRKKMVEETFDPIIKKQHEAHKEAVAQKKKFFDPLVEAEFNVKRKISDWRNEQERLRLAEERRLSEEARKLAESQAVQQAAELEMQGEPELAAQVIEEAAAAPAPVVVMQTFVPKQEGISSRVTWKFRIANEMEIPREYLMVNEKAIGAVVRAQKGLTKIPGIQVYSEDSISVKAS